MLTSNGSILCELDYRPNHLGHPTLLGGMMTGLSRILRINLGSMGKVSTDDACHRERFAVLPFLSFYSSPSLPSLSFPSSQWFTSPRDLTPTPLTPLLLTPAPGSLCSSCTGLAVPPKCRNSPATGPLHLPPPTPPLECFSPKHWCDSVPHLFAFCSDVFLSVRSQLS
jgi:hypothetical protein